MSGRRCGPPWLWAAALGPRLAFWLLGWADPGRCLRGDSEGYLALARNLLELRGFTSAAAPPFPPETFRTPGYPLFLALAGAVSDPPVLVAAFLQCLAGGLTVWLLWRWLRGFAGERGAALGAAALALDPVSVMHAPLILSETLFVLALTGALALTWKGLEEGGGRPRASWCGALWGAAAMVRPVSLYLPLGLCWVWRRDRKALACFLAAAYLLPAAWVLRNHRATGRWLFSSVGGVTLLRYSAAGIESLRTGRPWSETEPALLAAAARPGGYADDAELGAAYAALAGPILRAHPFLLVRYCAAGAAKTLAGAGWELLLEWTGRGGAEPGGSAFDPKVSGRGTLGLLRRHPGLIPLQAAYMLALAVLYALSGVGLWRLWRAGRRLEVLFLLEAALYFLAMASSQGYYRYRIPMMPVLAACAASALPRKSVTTLSLPD